MEPQIRSLLDEVPADFQPTFEAKPDDERVVGTLDDLDADTRRIVLGVLYFVEQAISLMAEGTALSNVHEIEHQQEGFVLGGETCKKNQAMLDTLEEKIGVLGEKTVVLQAASGSTVFEQFKLQPGEKLAFRTEGITAVLPEPKTGLPPGLAELLKSLGGRVTVIGG